MKISVITVLKRQTTIDIEIVAPRRKHSSHIAS